jgi:hypothetical protein
MYGARHRLAEAAASILAANLLRMSEIRGELLEGEWFQRVASN